MKIVYKYGSLRNPRSRSADSCERSLRTNDPSPALRTSTRHARHPKTAAVSQIIVPLPPCPSQTVKARLHQVITPPDLLIPPQHLNHLLLCHPLPMSRHLDPINILLARFRAQTDPMEAVRMVPRHAHVGNQVWMQGRTRRRSPDQFQIAGRGNKGTVGA